MGRSRVGAMLILCATEAPSQEPLPPPPRDATHTPRMHAPACATSSSGDIQCVAEEGVEACPQFIPVDIHRTRRRQHRRRGGAPLSIPFFSSINLRHGFSRTSGAAPVTMEATKNQPNWFRLNVSPKLVFACERSLVFGIRV